MADEENIAPQAPAEDVELDLGLKKKKKKKKAKLDLDNGEEKQGEDLVLDLKKKKKKSRKAKLEEAELPEVDQNDLEVKNDEPDYTYDQLLERVFNTMRRANPEMVSGEKKKFVISPPQCARVGTKKTSFVNFSTIVSQINRQPKHVIQFLFAELGTSGSVDGTNQLIIKGRFQQKQLETVLRRYIKEYVTCHTCRATDTTLEKRERLYFLRCNVCQSSCSVASIKTGFQAVTNKRARQRAKQA